jgi:hypothetical protein
MLPAVVSDLEQVVERPPPGRQMDGAVRAAAVNRLPSRLKATELMLSAPLKPGMRSQSESARPHRHLHGGCSQTARHHLWHELNVEDTTSSRQQEYFAL